MQCVTANHEGATVYSFACVPGWTTYYEDCRKRSSDPALQNCDGAFWNPTPPKSPDLASCIFMGIAGMTFGDCPAYQDYRAKLASMDDWMLQCDDSAEEDEADEKDGWNDCEKAACTALVITATTATAATFIPFVPPAGRPQPPGHRRPLHRHPRTGCVPTHSRLLQELDP